MRLKVLFIILFFSYTSFAQKKARPEYDYALITNKQYKNALVSFMKNQPKQVKLKIGQKVIYQLRGKKEIEKGVITKVNKRNIFIDEKAYPFSKIEMIGLFRAGRWVRMLVAPIIISSGAALITSGTYLGGYAVGTYLGESPFLFNLITINKEYFIFKTFPGVLIATVAGIGMDMLGLHVGKKGFQNLLAPAFRDKFKLARSKTWKLEPHQKEVETEEEAED